MDSPQMSRSDLRCDSDSRSLDSPKIKADYFRENALESPKLVAGLRNLHLDDHSGMDESGYYSPGKGIINIIAMITIKQLKGIRKHFWATHEIMAVSVTVTLKL